MATRTPKPKIELIQPEQLRIGVVRSCFNEKITSRQLKVATDTLQEYGIAYDVAEVAGCYEITYALHQMAQSGRYNGLVALGTLIRGETIHFDIIAQTVAHAIMDLIVQQNIPIGFGIVTAENEKQAVERVSLAADATTAVLELLNLKANGIL